MSSGRLSFILRFFVSVILIIVILWIIGGVKGVISLFSNTKPGYILLAFFVSTLDRMLMAFKWAWLLRTKQIYLSFFHSMKIYCASMIWGMFLPSTMGADAVRAISTSRKGYNFNEVLTSIVIERMIGFLSALCLGIIGILIIFKQSDIGPKIVRILWVACGLFSAALFGFALSLSQSVYNTVHDRIFHKFENIRIFKKIREFHASYQKYRYYKLRLFVFFLMTFIEQLMPILFNWLLAKSLHIEVGLIFMAGALPLSILIARLPISIDGFGVFEGAFIFLLSFAGCSAAQAVSIAFAGRIVQTLSWIPWWGADVLSKRSIYPPTTKNFSSEKPS